MYICATICSNCCFETTVSCFYLLPFIKNYKNGLYDYRWLMIYNYYHYYYYYYYYYYHHLAAHHAASQFLSFTNKPWNYISIPNFSQLVPLSNVKTSNTKQPKKCMYTNKITFIKISSINLELSAHFQRKCLRRQLPFPCNLQKFAKVGY